ncbi:MAG: hypothetical protein JNM84_15510 [Planctomycetes bacterium]|nr:hypothetical protein [Planctomycetota bacterium]
MAYHSRIAVPLATLLSLLSGACATREFSPAAAPIEELDRLADGMLPSSVGPAPLAQDPATSAESSPRSGASNEAPSEEAAAGTEKTWHIEVVPYLWAPAMHGQVGARGATAPVGINQSEILDIMKDDLQGAFVTHGEFAKDRFRFLADFSYINLESSTSTPLGQVESDMEQIIAELGVAYQVVDEDLGDGYRLSVEPLVGARLNYLDVEVELRGSGREDSGDQWWVDGFGGARFRVGAEEGPGVFGRFDAGAGGSDATWNALVGMDWRIGGWLAFTGGYRWLSIDYASGSGNDRIVYDILALGPFLGISFRF